ncbi:MAG: tetratricopeptide repeat protein, partial [Verrucomicrobia bacterium]|nr:tetratricopeptide repeat protein [Verrucomicrobiota bacterium]
MTRFIFILLFWLGIMSFGLAQDGKPAEAPAEAPKTPAPAVQEAPKTQETPKAPVENPPAAPAAKEETPAAPPEQPAAPPQPDEAAVFNAAVAAYNDSLFERAYKEFGDFCAKYPQSTNLVNATVYQGLSLYRDGKYTEMLNFFQPLMADTNTTILSEGKDRYGFWSGMAFFKLGDYPKTVSLLESVIKDYP